MSLPDLSDLDCQVCFNRFTSNSDQRKPRLLPCGHTFCSECLGILIVDNNIRCPTDRQDTAIDPEKGVLALKPNYNLIRLMADQPTTTNKCSASEECKADATLWCSECNAALCDHCSEHFHKKSAYEMARNHTICRLSERFLLKCEEHNKPLDVYCLEDQKVICSYCPLFGTHKGHSVEMLKKVAKERRKVYSDDIGKLEAIRVSVEKKMKTFSQLCHDDSKQQMDELKSHITKRQSELESELRRQIDQQHQEEKETLLKDLNEEFERIFQKELGNLKQTLAKREGNCRKKLELTAESKKTIRINVGRLAAVSLEIDKHLKNASYLIEQNDLVLMSTSGMSNRSERTTKGVAEAMDKTPTAESFTLSSDWVPNVNEFGIAKLNVEQLEAKIEKRKFMLVDTPESIQLSGFKFRSECNSIYDKTGIRNNRPLFQARHGADVYLWYHDLAKKWHVSRKIHIGKRSCLAFCLAINMDHPILLGTNSIWTAWDGKQEAKCKVCVKVAPSKFGIANLSAEQPEAKTEMRKYGPGTPGLCGVILVMVPFPVAIIALIVTYTSVSKGLCDVIMVIVPFAVAIIALIVTYMSVTRDLRLL